MIAKEMTKIHETFFRDEIDNIKLFNIIPKGELTVIISEKNNKKKIRLDDEKIINKAKKYLKNIA